MNDEKRAELRAKMNEARDEFEPGDTFLWHGEKVTVYYVDPDGCMGFQGPSTWGNVDNLMMGDDLPDDDLESWEHAEI